MTTESAEETKPTRTPAKPPLTARQWAEIEKLWKAGEVTYGALVKRYDRSVSTFERYFKKHKVIKGSDIAAIKKRVEQATAREEINDATVMAARIRETKEEHYRMSAALARLTWAEVLEAKKAGRPMATCLNNLKALQQAANVLGKAREERFAVLGLDRIDAVDPDAIPELVISELTPEQVEALRARDHTEAEDGPVKPDPAASEGNELDDGSEIVEEHE